MDKYPLSDEQFETQKSRIKAFIEKWITPLGLKWWREISFEYVNLCHKDDDEEFGRPFTCTVFWPNLIATIYCYMPMIAQRSDDDLEGDLVHELCHILVAEIADYNGKDHHFHVERIVTQLAMAFRLVGETRRAEVEKI